jgi:hypothetical protein
MMHEVVEQTRKEHIKDMKDKKKKAKLERKE